MKQPKSQHRTVNLAELARLFDVTTNTLKGWIAADPRFPVQKHGAPGVEYEFDLRDAIRWIRRNEAAAPDGETPQARKAYWDSVRIEMRVKKEAGLLADLPVANALLAEILVRLRTRAMRVPLALMRQFGLDRKFYNAAWDALAEVFNETADALQNPADQAAIRRAAAAWTVAPDVKARLVTKPEKPDPEELNDDE